MSIDWNHFTPWTSLAGGVLLGLASVKLMLLNGRVLGVSGILGHLIRPGMSERGWRLAFIAGLLVAPTVMALVRAPVPVRIEVGWPMVIVAGLLVGWGTMRGSGCTSGHGVCGLSRLSLRSLAATLCFMATGFATVFVLRHLLA